MIRHTRSILALAVLLAAPAREAAAHPRLVKAVPAADSRAAVAPKEIALTFNEALTLALSRITLTDGKQQVIALDTLRAGPGDPKTLMAKVTDPLVPGRYTVKWQAAGADGHPMRGELTFVIDPVAPTPSATPAGTGAATSPAASRGSWADPVVPNGAGRSRSRP